MSEQIQGNTIRLRREFVDFSGAAYDPTNASLKLYDTQKQQSGETVTVGAEHKVATGVYEVEVTLPIGHDMMICEFSGTDPRGKADVERKAIQTPWTR